jgi:hypothetical protein
MTKRVVFDCDKCGKETDPIHIKIPNGIYREMGGPSTEIIFEYEEKDLCPDCAKSLLDYLLAFKRTEKDGYVDWSKGSRQHPSAKSNDAVGLTLRFFNIKDKSE